MNESDNPNGETLYSRATFLRDLITREDWQNAHSGARSLMVTLAELEHRRQQAAAAAGESVTYVQAQPQQPRLELDARAVDEVVRRLAGIVEGRVQMVRPLLEHIERRQGDLANEVFKLAELIRAPRPKSDVATIGAMSAMIGTASELCKAIGPTPYAPKAAGGPVARQPNEPAPRRWWWNSLQAMATGLAAGAIFYGSLKALQIWLHW